jgi:hypothetical protein
MQHFGRFRTGADIRWAGTRDWIRKNSLHEAAVLMQHEPAVLNSEPQAGAIFGRRSAIPVTRTARDSAIANTTSGDGASAGNRFCKSLRKAMFGDKIVS